MALKAGYVGVKKNTIGKLATRSEMTILGAKNLLNNAATTKTSNGVTFTVNPDQTVKLDTAGSASTANADLVLNTNVALTKDTSYIISGGSNTTNDIKLEVKAYNGSTEVKTLASISDGKEKEFTPDYTGYDNIRVRIWVRSGSIISNKVIYPMIRLASDPIGAYVPYAMTNRELTLSVFEKGVLTNSNDLDNVTETGIYKIRSAPTHSPENTGFCSLIVNNIDTNQCIQIINKHNVMYQRRKFSPSTGVFEWSNWYKFTGTEVQASKSGDDTTGIEEESETKTTRSTKKTTTIKEGE